MKLNLSATFVILLLTITLFNVPSNAFPSNTEEESDGGTEEGSGSEDDQTSDVDKILALEGDSINDSDNEYDIVHKVVIETSHEEMDDDDDDGDDEGGDGDDSDGDDDEDDDDDDDEGEDDDEFDPTPYKKYKKWRGWRRHPLYVVILGG